MLHDEVRTYHITTCGCHLARWNITHSCKPRPMWTWPRNLGLRTADAQGGVLKLCFSLTQPQLEPSRSLPTFLSLSLSLSHNPLPSCSCPLPRFHPRLRHRLGPWPKIFDPHRPPGALRRCCAWLYVATWRSRALWSVASHSRQIQVTLTK